MKNKLFPIFLLFVFMLSACGNLPGSATNTALKASGVIEATEIAVAPELAGRVADISVSEGDSVKAGDLLFRLDAGLLKAQRDIAVAGLDSAKAADGIAESAVASAQSQYDMAYSAAMALDRANRTSDWFQTQKKDFTLPVWYYSQKEQISASQAAVDEARDALTKAQEKLTKIQSSNTDFIKTENDLAVAQANYDVAKNLYDRISKGKAIDDMTRRQLYLLTIDAELQKKGIDPRWVTVNKVSQDLRDEAKSIYDKAKSDLKDAQDAYDDALTTDAAKDILKARAIVSIAEERFYTAQDYVRVQQTGPEAQAVTAAQHMLDQALATATQSQNSVKQAQANLDLVDAQIAKLTVIAPLDGIVLARSIEPGEVLQAGMTALTIGKLDSLKVTVYLPENQYGVVHLGDTASISVDSFPGQTFPATVTQIANQAEFTPRNVQTQEGRQTTVYAVQLSVKNSDGKLKPGMPVDVTFGK